MVPRRENTYNEAPLAAADERLLVVVAAVVVVRAQQSCLLLHDGDVHEDHFLFIPDPEIEAGHFRRKLEQRKPELLIPSVQVELQVQVFLEEEVQTGVDNHFVQQTDRVAPSQEDALKQIHSLEPRGSGLIAETLEGKFFFSASTGDEQQQFRPDSWVPIRDSE